MPLRWLIHRVGIAGKRLPQTYWIARGRLIADDQMGNSEVGHIHIGTGRYIPQEFSKVNDAIRDGGFFTNPVLCRAVDLAKDKGKALHIMGLLSPGGVHSHEEQILAMVELAAKRGLSKIYLHAFLDGRMFRPKVQVLPLNCWKQNLLHSA